MAEEKKPTPSGALNVDRRTWDLEHFGKIAKERLEKVSRYMYVCIHLTLSSIIIIIIHPPSSPSSLILTHHFLQGPEEKKPGFVRKREEFMPADDGAAGPGNSKRAYLKHRQSDLGLDDKVGKVQVSGPFPRSIWRSCM